jgi:hypothetical protein
MTRHTNNTLIATLINTTKRFIKTIKTGIVLFLRLWSERILSILLFWGSEKRMARYNFSTI